MKYPAAELKAEAYIAYSKDAFNDEEQGLVHFLGGRRVNPTAGRINPFDEILSAPIDIPHYTKTALPEIDKIVPVADDGSGKSVSRLMSLDNCLDVDHGLDAWLKSGTEYFPGEFSISVPAHLYEKWENYRHRSSSYKKKHPKPGVNDEILIKNCGTDYFFKTSFYPPRAYVEITYKKYIHVHGAPKLEWLAVPECIPSSDLELDDYIFYERESALNLAIEISAALADFHDLDTSYGNRDKTFYNIALFELKQRLLPDLLNFNAIYFRIAVARTFVYALLNRLTDQMNSGWEDADAQTQYQKIEAWIAQIVSFLKKILYPFTFNFTKAEDMSREVLQVLDFRCYSIQFCDRQQVLSTNKAYPKVCNGKGSNAITPNSFAIFCNPEHPNVAFYLDRISAYSRDLLKAKETCSENLKLPNISRCRDFKSEIFTEVYRAISAEMEKIKNS